VEIVGEYTIPQSQMRTWEAVCDAEIMKACIPGCETLERTSPTEFHLTMKTKIASLTAQFRGRITVADAHAPDTYTIVFEGQGGMAGFVTGLAHIKLEPAGKDTRLHYDASAKVGGKLAQVSARMVDSVAQKLTSDFFSAFSRHLGRERG
jgi:carbon monoxide dehydrogenase subunit G